MMTPTGLGRPPKLTGMGLRIEQHEIKFKKRKKKKRKKINLSQVGEGRSVSCAEDVKYTKSI